VFPVPAPAETKTSPVASTAACCCSFTLAPELPPERARARSRALHAAHRPQVAPRRALAALRIVANVPAADLAGQRPRLQTRLVDRRPERLLLEIVVPGVAPERVALARTEKPA